MSDSEKQKRKKKDGRNWADKLYDNFFHQGVPEKERKERKELKRIQKEEDRRDK